MQTSFETHTYQDFAMWFSSQEKKEEWHMLRYSVHKNVYIHEKQHTKMH